MSTYYKYLYCFLLYLCILEKWYRIGKQEEFGLRNRCSNQLFHNVFLIIVSSLGGFLLSLTGMSIGWMIGSLMMAGFLSFYGSKWKKESSSNKGIHPYWRHIGQGILGIQLGQSISLSIFDTFEDHFIIIFIILIFSIIFALLSGLVLWRYSKADMMTSLFGTTPGGISAMPTIAEEVGANTMIVSIVQTLRIFLVVGTIPLLAGAIQPNPVQHTFTHSGTSLNMWTFTWTILLVIGALSGAYTGKRTNLPAPWLVGGMLGTAVIQTVGSSVIGKDLAAWWPHVLIILAQILIGTSIGSRVHREMFNGSKQVITVGLLTSTGLVTAMALCSFLISMWTHIPLITCILAFAPGGVAEMATTSLTLHADSTFVVAVQSLRLMTILLILPSLFRLLNSSSFRNSVLYRKRLRN